MPVLYTEFGTSYTGRQDIVWRKGTGFLVIYMYSTIYSSASNGGAAAESLFWQLMTTGMTYFDDGYDIVMRESPSTANIIGQQSQKLERIRRKLYMEKLKGKKQVLQVKGLPNPPSLHKASIFMDSKLRMLWTSGLQHELLGNFRLSKAIGTGH
ncbi:hypothetical protein QQ045_011104 [Rhodiola kirilowii]